MELKSSLELLLALLYTNNKEEIRGATRLSKLIFLLIKEGGFSDFEKELEFEPYDYGPWSSKITVDYPQTLMQLGVITVESIPTTETDLDSKYLPIVINKNRMNVYRLTDDGIKVGRTYFERLDAEKRTIVENMKKNWNKRKLAELLEYVYFRHTKYSSESKIKEEVLSKLNISSRFSSLIGIIPYISLNEEKELTREITSGKH